MKPCQVDWQKLVIYDKNVFCWRENQLFHSPYFMLLVLRGEKSKSDCSIEEDCTGGWLAGLQTYWKNMVMAGGISRQVVVAPGLVRLMGQLGVVWMKTLLWQVARRQQLLHDGWLKKWRECWKQPSISWDPNGWASHRCHYSECSLGPGASCQWYWWRVTHVAELLLERSSCWAHGAAVGQHLKSQGQSGQLSVDLAGESLTAFSSPAKHSSLLALDASSWHSYEDWYVPLS